MNGLVSLATGGSFWPGLAVNCAIMVTGQQLKYARQRLRMSQEELATELRVGTRTVRRWEGLMELPEAAIPAVEPFLAKANDDQPAEPTLSEASDIQLATELLQRISRRNGLRSPIDGRIGRNVPDPNRRSTETE